MRYLGKGLGIFFSVDGIFEQLTLASRQCTTLDVWVLHSLVPTYQWASTWPGGPELENEIARCQNHKSAV